MKTSKNHQQMPRDAQQFLEFKLKQNQVVASVLILLEWRQRGLFHGVASLRGSNRQIVSSLMGTLSENCTCGYRSKRGEGSDSERNRLRWRWTHWGKKQAGPCNPSRDRLLFSAHVEPQQLLCKVYFLKRNKKEKAQSFTDDFQNIKCCSWFIIKIKINYLDSASY